MVPHHRVVLYKALLAFAVTVVWPVWPSAAIIGVAAMTSKNQNNQNGIFGAIHKQYAPLSKTSQGLTCAVLGFTGARVLVNSASTVVKVAGVAFLATEVLDACGVLESRIPEKRFNTALLPGEQHHRLTIAHGRIVQSVHDFRTGIRRPHSWVKNPKRKLEQFIRQEPQAAFGGAVGAMAGFLL